MIVQHDETPTGTCSAPTDGASCTVDAQVNTYALHD